MSALRIYRTPVREYSLDESSSSTESTLSRLGLLDGTSSVTSVSTNPPDFRLSVQFSGKYADRLALELSELFEAQQLQDLPLAPRNGSRESDGYYAVNNDSIERVEPQTDKLVKVDADLVKSGTRSSHRRALRCRVTQPDPGNTFGNDTTALVAAPTDASRVRWYDRSFTESAAATAVDTVTARFGDLDRYDARDVSGTLGDDPVLVYKSPSLDAEGDVDVGVWDTYGARNPVDNEGTVQWGRVFDPAHDPRSDDEFVVENGLIRLWLQDGEDDQLRAERWDAAAGAWSDVSLGSSNWALVETDLIEIGAAAVDAQCVFVDGSGTEYALDLRLERGYESPQWMIPSSETDPVPSGLQTLLDPIADESVYQTGASLGLVARSNLRR